MRHLRPVAAACLFACLASAAIAQTSFPMIWSVYPAGVERGKTTEVTVNAGGSEGGGGGNLYRAYKVLFEGDGVKAEIVPPEKGWPAPDPKKPNETPVVDHVTMRVTVAANAALGTREFRVGTPIHGISTVGQLVIDDEPSVLEKEPNNDIQHAQTVTIPCVVEGKLSEDQDIDSFKFHAAAGQQIVFSVLCAKLEDKVHDLNMHADPLLILRDAGGAEIAREDDYYGADPMLPYRFDKAGDYFIQIRDVGYQNNAHWVYRLQMTSRPYVISAVPCAVQPGKRAELHVAGYNLGSAQTVALDVPAGALPGVWETQLALPNGTSNLVKLIVTAEPQTSVAVPVQSSSGGTGGASVVTASVSAPAPIPIRASLALPGGVNAWLASPGRPDRYAFHAKKGEPWAFEITSRRLDSLMDSELRIRKPGGDLLASNDDAIGKDSRIEWSAPEDGDYVIDVSDVAGNSGPACFYNLTAQRLKPDFELKCDCDRAMIPPGGHTTWYVIVDRKVGFEGDVTVHVEGLPTGVSVAPLTIPGKVQTGALILTADPGAKVDTSLVRIIGAAELPAGGGKTVQATREVRPLMEVYAPGGGRIVQPDDLQGVSVVERSDVEVTTDTKAIRLTQGGTAKIEVTIKRMPGYAKPVTLDVMVQHLGSVFANPLPNGVSVDDGASKTLLNENETKGWVTLKAAGDAQQVKDLPLAIMANVSINFVMKVWYSTPEFTLTVVPPPKK